MLDIVDSGVSQEQDSGDAGRNREGDG